MAEHNIEVIALLPTLTDTEMARHLKLFRWVMPMTTERVAQTLVSGLRKNRSEILVGWQSYLAVLCQRLFHYSITEDYDVVCTNSIFSNSSERQNRKIGR